jgi:hypothetical protein
MYYVKVLNPLLQKNDIIDSLCNKTVQSVKMEHMTPFHKRLLVYDPTLGPEFLEQVHVHYDMNLDLKMLTKKLQMLVLAQVTNEQKAYWLKQWNQSLVL